MFLEGRRSRTRPLAERHSMSTAILASREQCARCRECGARVRENIAYLVLHFVGLTLFFRQV